MAVRCAILDDYQNVAVKSADWSKVKGDVEIKVVQRASRRAGQSVIAALKDFAIVIAMRERTGISRAGDRSTAQPQAPDHHRHAQRLDRYRGSEGARRHGLRHRLVRQPDVGHRHRADARTDPPHRLRECPAARRRHLAEHHRPRPRRHDARHSRTGQTRRPHRRHRQGVRHEGDCLEPKPHGRAVPGGWRRSRRQGRPVSPVGLHHHPQRAVAALARHWSAPRSSA